MTGLAEFLLGSIVSRPENMQLSAVEGDSSLLLELRLDPEDVALLRRNRSQLFRAIQVVLNAASGPRKTVLDLLDDSRDGGDEE